MLCRGATQKSGAYLTRTVSALGRNRCPEVQIGGNVPRESADRHNLTQDGCKCPHTSFVGAIASQSDRNC